jgi:hypothetical protein
MILPTGALRQDTTKCDMSKLTAKPTRIETSFVIVTDIQSERTTSVTVVAKTEPRHYCSYGCSQPLLRHVLGEQRRIQILVGMVPYRRRQGPENVLASL